MTFSEIIISAHYPIYIFLILLTLDELSCFRELQTPFPYNTIGTRELHTVINAVSPTTSGVTVTLAF